MMESGATPQWLAILGYGFMMIVAALLPLLITVRYFNNQEVTVEEINIYPIKSCAEVRVTAALATPLGFENDRIAQVTDAKGKFCTPRDKDKAKLFHIKPTFSSSQGENKVMTLTAPNVSAPLSLDVSTAQSKAVQVEVLAAPAPVKLTLQDYGDKVATWLEQATGIPGCRLTGIGKDYKRNVNVNPDQNEAVPHPNPVSLADEAPYLLTNTASLEYLNERLESRDQARVPMERFRPNIVVTGLRPWEEDGWKRIRIGETAEFHVWQRCGRCTMTTIDRQTLDRSGEPLATLSTFRERAHGQRNFGMHLIPVDSGNHIIRMGDKLVVLEYDEERKKEWVSQYSVKLK